MPRLNFILLWLAAAVAFLCYQRADRNAYGTYFLEALETIHHHALEEVDEQTLFNAAIEGMTDELDEFSSFVTREDTEEYQKALDQHFSGIGIEVREKKVGDEYHILVSNTLIGTPHPAHDAGMRPGDRIMAIDDERLEGRRLTEAVKLIRGPVGEPVRITIIHDGETAEEELSIVRADIEVDSVLGDVRGPEGEWVFQMEADPRITYIRVKTFGSLTTDELRAALHQARENGDLNSLIVDVRDNSGGYLKSAHEVCDLFISQGVIVTTRGRDKKAREQLTASAAGTFTGFPMVVLINGESASASEIFAACMQDHRRAKILGSRTYGKGSVQQMIPMERNRSILKLTTATYWRPSEKNIHRMSSDTEEDEWGVRPDKGLRIKLTQEQEEERILQRRERDRSGGQVDGPGEVHLDPQLQKAVEILRSDLAKSTEA